MKTIAKKIALLILFALSLNIVFNGMVSAPIQAAGMTKQQKAKEAQKKKKLKEVAKRKKAQQKAKAKAAKKKAKAKAKAAKQKAKNKTKKLNVSSKAAQTPKLTPEEAYVINLAEVEKYNAHVARYMSRDITHRLGLWGQVGYSNLLPSDINYNADQTTGFSVNSKGGVGGGGGLGYQMRYKSFLLTTGVEMQVYTSLYELSTTEKGLISRSFGMYPYSGEMQYTYKFANAAEALTSGFVQVPVLMGMEFANKYAYFLAGPKVGLGLIGQSVVSGNLSTSIYDQMAIDPYSAMANHALVSDKACSTNTNLNWNLNLAMYGEIGMSLDPWIKQSLFSTRLALFAEYGVLNIQTSKNLVGDNDQPVDYSRAINGGHLVNDVAMVSSLSTTTTAMAKINPLLVGVKASLWFNLPRKDLRMKSLPKEPMPLLLARVVNVDDGNALMGAMVKFTSEDNDPVNKTTNNQGVVSVRLTKGEYTLKASKVGYYDDSITYSLTATMRDTLLIGLRPEPKPIVYTLAGRVFDQEDQHALECDVQLTSMDEDVLYSGASTDDGLFVTNLLAGQYKAHIRCQGYMPLDQDIQFVQDTLSFYMTKIKEGVKVKINNLYFATGRTYILPESETALQDLTKFLLDNESVRIRIVGHTDNVGSDRSNQILSEGRANSLRMELIKRGVDASRIEAEGKGETEPIDTNDTEEGRQNNRRVEFTIIDTGSLDIQQIH